MVDEVFARFLIEMKIIVKSDGTPHQSLRDSFPYR